MRIMIGMGHPKDVHFWKNIINNFVKGGHEIKILAWDKDVTLYLLNIYGYSYEILGRSCKYWVRKLYELLKSEHIAFKIANEFKPDILVGREPCFAHVSKLIGKPFIAFSDTEHSTLSHWLTYPFSDVICTPSCFKKRVDPRRHITFNGYQELSYLHPKYFKPDQSVLDALGLSKEDRFFIIRFVSWEATHDIGKCGFADKEKFIRELEDHGRVYITSEGRTSKFLEKYRITIPPEKMHDILYYATLYIGEGATMASEAAVLGTPAIYVNTLKVGYLDELEKRYGLVFNFPGGKTAQERAFSKAIELLEEKHLKSVWRKKKEKLLSEKVDVTKFVTELIEKFATTA